MICGKDCLCYKEGGRCYCAPGGLTGFNTVCDDMKCFKPKTMNKDMKVCSRCGRELPLDEFPLSGRSRDGHLHVCRECNKAARRDASLRWWNNNRENLKAAAPTLASFSDADILAELRSRGWKGSLQKTETMSV